MLNSLFVIAAVGCLIAFVFMAGQGLAHHMTVLDVVSDRWYLLGGFVVAAGLGLILRGRRRRPV